MSESSQSSDIEHLGQGVRRYWRAPCIAVIETDGEMSRSAVDIWAEATTRTIRDYPDSYKAIYLLQNLSHPNQRLTTYSRQKTEEIYKSVILTRPLYVARWCCKIPL